MSLNQNDILLGKGGNTFKHPGNERLRKQCKNLALVYGRCDRRRKAKIIDELLAKILRTSRFMKKIENVQLWVPADYKTAREKVSQTLRDSVTKMKKHGSNKKNRKKLSPRQGSIESIWNISTTVTVPQHRTEASHILFPFDEQEKNVKKSITTTRSALSPITSMNPEDLSFALANSMECGTFPMKKFDKTMLCQKRRTSNGELNHNKDENHDESSDKEINGTKQCAYFPISSNSVMCPVQNLPIPIENFDKSLQSFPNGKRESTSAEEVKKDRTEKLDELRNERCYEDMLFFLEDVFDMKL